MAIYRLLQGSAFGPDEISLLSSAYEDARRALNLAPDSNDQMTQIAAAKIIELAQRGVRDHDTLLKMTLQEFGSSK
jgi:hypothetical protein